jgi:hypothetical protein
MQFCQRLVAHQVRPQQVAVPPPGFVDQHGHGHIRSHHDRAGGGTACSVAAARWQRPRAPVAAGARPPPRAPPPLPHAVHVMWVLRHVAELAAAQASTARCACAAVGGALPRHRLRPASDGQRSAQCGAGTAGRRRAGLAGRPCGSRASLGGGNCAPARRTRRRTCRRARGRLARCRPGHPGCRTGGVPGVRPWRASGVSARSCVGVAHGPSRGATRVPGPAATVPHGHMRAARESRARANLTAELATLTS